MAVTAGEPNASKSKPTFQPDELLNRWNLMSDIYVMGLRCDIFRFGNLQLFASSDRIFMRGDYNGMPGKPNAVVGRHIASAASTLDPIARAGNHYARMAGYADFIKPILYQDVMALRLKDTVENWSAGIFKNLPPQAALDLLGIFNNYSQKVLPSFKALDSEALPARYVFEETRRLVALSEGKCAVFPGLGVNVPHRVGKAFAGSAFDLQGISASVQMAFEAGATGVVASREYDEMRLPALRAFGDGVRSAGKRQGGGATKVPAAQP